MKTAVYLGSFDPVTNGHFDIITRASFIFDKVIVAVLKNPEKKSLLDVKDRLYFLEKVCSDFENVEVDSFDGLAVDYAKLKDASVFIRGIRSVSDFDYELNIFLVNRELEKNVDTVFLPANKQNFGVSSGIVKQIACFGGDISKFVPKKICCELIMKLKNKMGEIENEC